MGIYMHVLTTVRNAVESSPRSLSRIHVWTDDSENEQCYIIYKSLEAFSQDTNPLQISMGVNENSKRNAGRYIQLFDYDELFVCCVGWKLVSGSSVRTDVAHVHHVHMRILDLVKWIFELGVLSRRRVNYDVLELEFNSIEFITHNWKYLGCVLGHFLSYLCLSFFVLNKQFHEILIEKS